MRPLRRLIGEPLVHFLLLGVAVLVLGRVVGADGDARQITVPASVVQGLRQDHLRRTGALPTSDEEAALVQRFVDDEVLYREAIALGLERGDVIVRRRLVQKMEFLTEGLGAAAEPSDADLSAYLQAHAARWAIGERVSLTHVFVGTDRHGADAPALAESLHRQLAAGADAATLGDPFLRGMTLRQQDERGVAAVFGPAFAAEAMRLPAGPWSAPIRSSYGFHVVRIDERLPAEMPTLAAVRADVEREWRNERRAEAGRSALATIRGRYDVRIDSVPPVPAVATR